MTPALEAAYAQPHRRYHTHAHIDDCLAKLTAVPALSDPDRRLLTWAIWWRDAVYDPMRERLRRSRIDTYCARRSTTITGRWSDPCLGPVATLTVFQSLPA